MGWSFSPFCCQVLAWLLLLYRRPGEEELFEAISTDTMPKYLKFRKARGLATVLYDNFGIVAEDASALDEIRARLIRNLNLFEVVIKDGSNKRFLNKDIRDDLRRDEEHTEDGAKKKLPVHLGVQMGIIQQGLLYFAWRADPEKIEKWKMDIPSHEGPARAFARFVGRIIWFHSLQLQPLFTIEPILSIAKKLGRFVGTKYRMWDAQLRLESEDLQQLEKHYADVLKNRWIRRPHEQTTEHMYLFTDASNTGWGFVLCTTAGTVVDWGKYEWNAGATEWHIFIKEVAAAVWSMALCNRPYRFLTVFIDNTAAEHAVGRGFSANEVATLLMRRSKIETVAFETRRIDTALNPSDGPSRGLDCDENFVKRACSSLDQYVVEGRAGPPPKTRFAVRHLEPLAEEAEERTQEGSVPAVHIVLQELEDDPATLPPAIYSRVKLGLAPTS
jgi:hypothetical protein